MKRILFAEDDPLMVRMYERLLKLNELDVTMALDGADALDKVRAMEPKPDLILLDVMMPKMNGFDVLQVIKSEEGLKQIPVALLSNLAGKENIEQGLALGAAAYLVKSQYKPKEIVNKVKELLGEKEPTSSIPER